jgi:hypothetical protein
MVKAFAETLGIQGLELKIQKMKEKQKGLDEMEVLGKIVQEELGIKPLETKMVRKRRRNNEGCDNHKKYESKIIEEQELVSHIDEGWEIIRELKGGKLIIRRDL